MAIFPPPFPTGSSLAELCQEIKSIDVKTRDLGRWQSGAFSNLARSIFSITRKMPGGAWLGWEGFSNGNTKTSCTFD